MLIFMTIGSQSRSDGRGNKRSYSSSADHSSGYRQAGEEQGSPSKIPRTSPYQQSSLGQMIPPQTLRPLFDNSPGNDEGFQILYSGELRKRQRSASVISIDDDEVDDGDDDGNPNRSDLLFMFDHVNRDASNPTFPAGITVKDFMSDEDFNRYMANEQEPKRYQQSLNLKSRLPSMTIRPARIAIYKHDYHGLRLSNGVSVELQNGDFMKIAELQKDTFSMTIYLRGRLFRRMRFMGGTIEKKMNEICLMQKINQADVRNHKEQALEEVDVQYVARRRSLRMTNRPFPELSFREEDYISPKSVIMNERVLVCRWRYICSFPNERALQKNAHCEKALIALRPDEADEADAKWSQDNEALRRNFRGYTIKGGASSTVRPVESPLIQEEHDSTRKASNRSKGLLPMTSTANSLFNSPGSPGSSFDTPFNVDLHLSRMSLKPVDFWLNGPGTVSKTTDKAHEANPRVSLPRQKATGVLPNSSNGAVIDLTFDERHYSRHEELRQESRGDHRQNDNGSKECKANTGRSNAQSQPRASTTANLWDVRNGVFVEKNVRWSTSPKPGSPSDSDSTVTGDDNTAAADHEEVQEVPRQHFYDGHIGNHTELLMRGQSGIFGRRNTVDTLRTGRNLQRYTFGDGFSGCGGVSRGATMAGLKLQWAFDFQRAMCKSYCRNFRASRVYCIDAFDFATRLNIDAQVDILHLSPPCQFFSPAHTTQGINDDSNTASSFVIGELLKKAKPRIVTLENTLGLEQRHPLYLHAVIQQFTVLGFSIRWKTIDLRDYGVPQSRRRLIIIAAW